MWIVLGLAKPNENRHLKLMHHIVANHESLRKYKNIMFPSHIELDNISNFTNFETIDLLFAQP